MPTAPASVKDLNFAPSGKVMPSPRDWRDQVIYQLLLDRFDDNQDHPAYDPKTAKKGRDAKCGCIFQGGQIKGVTRRLDYIQNLGATTIWISPPFKNRQGDPNTCHGGGIKGFLDVDPRFGTLADLQELVREAHARNMYVVLDIVINHTADAWGYPDDGGRPFNPDGQYDFGFWRGRNNEHIPHDKVQTMGRDDGVWPVELQDPDAFKRRGEIRDLMKAQGDEAINGDFFALKDLNLPKPEILDAIIRCYKYWIAIADVDGFRMDTVGNTEPTQTAVFINAIREYARAIGKDNFLIFAEVVGDDERLQQYVGQNTPNIKSEERYPEFTAVLDFPLYFVLEEVIKGFQTPENVRQRYEWFRRYYRDFGEAGKYFVTFVDNHDQMTRPFRRFSHGVTDWRQTALAIGYVLTNIGTPCIYYGTEQGFDGAGDSDFYVREAMFGGTWGAFDSSGMHCFNPNNPIYKTIAAIAKVRAAVPALRYGRQYFREISGDGENFGHPIDGHCTLAFSRVLDTQSIVVAMNIDHEPRKDCVLVDSMLHPPGTEMVDLLNPERRFKVETNKGGQAYVCMPLEPHGISILQAAK
jgi:glycosidase